MANRVLLSYLMCLWTVTLWERDFRLKHQTKSNHCIIRSVFSRYLLIPLCNAIFYSFLHLFEEFFFSKLNNLFRMNTYGHICSCYLLWNKKEWLSSLELGLMGHPACTVVLWPCESNQSVCSSHTTHAAEPGRCPSCIYEVQEHQWTSRTVQDAQFKGRL